MQGTWVQLLVGELRSSELHDTTKKGKKDSVDSEPGQIITWWLKLSNDFGNMVIIVNLRGSVLLENMGGKVNQMSLREIGGEVETMGKDSSLHTFY